MPKIQTEETKRKIREGQLRPEIVLKKKRGIKNYWKEVRAGIRSKPKRTGRKPKSIEERFWSKVNKRGVYCKKLKTRCWEWKASKISDGYGYFRGFTGQYAHRCSWELHFGKIPTGLCVCHRCDNPACVNPDHLFLGTKQDNSNDMIEKGRQNSPVGDRHGLRKHPGRAAKGDRNGTRLHPERLPRGDKHWSKVKSECIARGDSSGARKHPEKIKRGVEHYDARLTVDSVLEIRRVYRLKQLKLPGGISQHKLAIKYGVSQGAISSIIRRTAWKHI